MFTKRLMSAALATAMCWPALAEDRLSTAELSEHLHAIAKGEKNPKYEIDYEKTALSFGMSASDLLAKGGFFGSEIQTPMGARVFKDNEFRYLWSVDPSNDQVLPEGEGYVNIIAQGDGRDDQAELLKYVKEGDVVVYWHPEYRDSSPDTYNQWRATHAATIVEVQSNGKTYIATADIPAGYARPFDGSARTPAHVFRYVKRDSAGKIISATDDYGKQIARWATMAFGRFSFNGDYGSMDIKEPWQMKGIAKEYLDPQGDIPSMYCAWYAWTNVNLGAMCPIGSGCVAETLVESWNRIVNEPQPFSFVENASNHGFSNIMYGEGSLADYQQTSITSHDNWSEFGVKNLTPLNMVANFASRVFGSDKDHAEKGAQAFAQHAGFMSQFLSSSIDSFMYEFSQSAGRFYATPTEEQDDSGYTITQEQADAYDASIRQAMQEFAGIYGQASQAVAGGQKTAIDAEAEIRAKLSALNAEIRSGKTREENGRRWIPPYGFAAEAEATERLLQADGESPYLPAMVYVGTILHKEKFLKPFGDASQDFLSPKKPLAADPRDAELDAKILAALGLSAGGSSEPQLQHPGERPGRRPAREAYARCATNDTDMRRLRDRRRCRREVRAAHRELRRQYDRDLAAYEAQQNGEAPRQPAADVDATQALFDRLVAESADNYDWGLNPFETAALKASIGHFDESLLSASDDTLRASEGKVIAHNDFGMDKNMLRRWLVSYWNNPKSVRATLYSSTNGGKLFKLPSNSAELATLSDPDAFFRINSELKSDAERKSISENRANDTTNAQPRLTAPIVCGGDRPADQVVTPENPNCN